MKLAVRMFVVLALTGAGAFTQTASAAAENKIAAARHSSAIDVPNCPPDASDACGITTDSGSRSIRVGD